MKEKQQTKAAELSSRNLLEGQQSKNQIQIISNAKPQ
jgi:hypothetical protein